MLRLQPQESNQYLSYEEDVAQPTQNSATTAAVAAPLPAAAAAATATDAPSLFQPYFPARFGSQPQLHQIQPPPAFEPSTHPLELWQNWYEKHTSALTPDPATFYATFHSASVSPSARFPVVYEYTDALNQPARWRGFLTGAERRELDEQLRRFMLHHRLSNMRVRPAPRGGSGSGSSGSTGSSRSSGSSGSSAHRVRKPQRRKSSEAQWRG